MCSVYYFIFYDSFSTAMQLTRVRYLNSDFEKELTFSFIIKYTNIIM